LAAKNPLRSDVPTEFYIAAKIGWIRSSEPTVFAAARQFLEPSEHVARPKPAPDVYLLAAERLGAGTAGVVAIEDSASGVAAASAAGLRCITVRTALTRGHDHGGATLTVGSLAELDPSVLDRVASADPNDIGGPLMSL
jgi:beta-phosphoglucomutase-like phosphatase (HAD superfamily)